MYFNTLRLLQFFLLFACPILAQSELPFLTFSNATLRVAKREVVEKEDQGRYTYFPVFSYNAPRHSRKAPRTSIPVQSMDGDLLLIVDDEVGLVSHYFHIMEHLMGIWNFCVHENPDRIQLILFAFKNRTAHDHRWVGLNETTRILLNSLFPNATIGLLEALPSNLNLKARKIHVSSRIRSHGIPDCDYTNMNGSSRFEYHPNRLRQMRDYLFDKMGIEMQPRGNHLRVTYCKRTTGRMLDPVLEDQLLESIAQETNNPVNVVDFARISFHEQLQTVANTDLFIGIHGNGLTHLLFLPDHASVLEYYQGGESAFFRLFAQLRGIRYYGNSQGRWETETYLSIQNKAPFQDSVTHLDLQGTLDLIRRL